MKEKKKIPSLSIGTVAIKQAYEGNVAARAIKRAGKNKNLKGHIFEYLTVDKINQNPVNIIKGKKAVLTKSPTAVRDDIIVKQGKKIVKRMQLKDTPKGIKDTVNRVVNKQYAGTNLVGTKETVKAYANEVVKRGDKGTKIAQKMSTNGISSAQTEIIAKKALGGSIVKHAGAIAGQASKIGVKTAGLSVAMGTVANVRKIARKEITMKKAVMNITKDGAVNGVSAAIGDAAATGVTIVVATTPAAPVAAPIGTAAGVGATIVADHVIRNTDISRFAKRIKKSRAKTYHKVRYNSGNYKYSGKRDSQPAMG